MAVHKLVVALAVLASAPAAQAVPPALTVSPATSGKHGRVVVTFTGTHATGVFGQTRRTYVVEAHAVHPASACVNNRDRFLTGRPAGARLRATLDPARGDGGPQGWCRGAFRGTVRYVAGFACPTTGRCHPPTTFPHRSRLVARFRFAVR